MKLSVVAVPNLATPALDRRVRKDVSKALGAVQTVAGSFIVNDTLWLAVNDRGKVTPCVMNSAKFISGIFLNSLSRLGWSLEKTIIEQTIDAYIALPQPGQAYRVPDKQFVDYFQAYTSTTDGLQEVKEAGGLDRLFSRLYGTLVSRPFVHPTTVPDLLQRYAEPVPESVTVRIGLEFETGNIASSFRSLLKLGLLYAAQEIDLGVFITSIDKPSCATRIWPTTNRNGSFQELKQRNYQRMVILPLWEFGFAPDGFSSTTGYLAGDGSLYTPKSTNGKHVDGGVEYDVHIRPDGKRVLRLPAKALLV
jgi:hypothetical protein